jgi:methyl-accepting chemotaxis protein
MTAMAGGDFTQPVQAEYVGDFETIKRSIHRIESAMNETLGKIHQSTDQVSAGANQVSNAAQELAQGASEQATTVQQMASTLSAASVNIRKNAESIEGMTAKIEGVGGDMAASNEKMRAMIAAMAQIKDSSGEIAKIIKTIEDIAFQTNILALNAAVEAARAGAAGQGFAVVADEVRNLASKSAEASKNTAALIETSVAAVDNGSKIAEDTGAALISVVEEAEELVGTMKTLSRGTNEQAAVVDEITQGVDQISAVVQSNSATAQQSAAASEELSGQAQMMREMVQQFTIEEHDAARELARDGAELEEPDTEKRDKY